ncbi:hypothetical protein B0T14DRAFT_422342, partial [Immersiella caudata]
ALSYFWGSDEKPRAFRTYTGSTPTTESPFSFLTRLRDPTMTQAVWADAICITQ